MIIPLFLEHFADILASLHELCGFPHTAAYLVVSLDDHRHKQFIVATQINQIASQPNHEMVGRMASAQNDNRKSGLVTNEPFCGCAESARSKFQTANEVDQVS